MSLKKRIISIFFENQYPQDIQDRFHKWLTDSHQQEEKDMSLHSLWDSLNAEADSSTLDSLRSVESKLSFSSERLPVKHTFISYFSKIAAILLVAILSGFFTYKYFNSEDSNEPIKLSECFASNGELRTITLPDNTVVTINSGSVIIYPENQNGKERFVYLNGEAYFEVSHNPEIPFIVKTDGLDVKVLGTKFNVSAYSEDPNITTTLEEGKVKLSFRDPNLKDLALRPSEQIIYNKITNEITSSRVSDQYIAAWKEGHLLFTGASIYDVLRSFEHRYGVSVYLNSNKYEKDKLTVKFVHGESLEESMRILQLIVPEFKYKLEKNKLYIY